MSDLNPADLDRAAEAIADAGALLVTAGAGMGVDSGLPDFRGNQGFWKAYPPLEHLGISFADMANPRWFHEDPHRAWGFYGHRRGLYRSTQPHAGFDLLRAWGDAMPGGVAVFTSNVDGQFQRAGYPPDLVYECHGAIEFEQCMRDCGAGVYPAGPDDVRVDLEVLKAADPLPVCPDCGALSRPNVLMFGDGGYDSARDRMQRGLLKQWLAERDPERLVVVECGAGTAIPSVRHFSRIQRAGGATLIRINPREPQAPPSAISLASGALEALQAIAARLT